MNNAPYTIIADTREQMLEIAMALTASGYHFKARPGVGATWIIELTGTLEEFKVIQADMSFQT